MTNYRNHLIIGFITTILMVLILNWQVNYLEFFIIVALFSLLPDIDHRASNASRILHLLTMTSLILLLFFNLTSIFFTAYLVILELYHLIKAKNSKRHRALPHTMTFGLTNSLIVYLITNSLMNSLIALTAFTSHLIADKHLMNALKRDKKLLRL